MLGFSTVSALIFSLFIIWCRKNDYNHFLTSLFVADPIARNAIFAFRAFNIETALVQDVAKTPEIALMRLEWWKSAIDDALNERPPSHPALTEVSIAAKNLKPSKMWFTKILNQRIEMLSRSNFATLDAMETYAEQTASSLLYLQLEALGIRNSNIEHACGHLGKAIGIATLLKGFPHALQSQRIYIPSQILANVTFSICKTDLF